MLIVAGSINVDPARRDEYLAGSEEGMRLSRDEPGCRDYVLSADPLDPGRVVLFERWESQEALDTHMAALASRPPAAGADAVKGAEILKYEIGSSGPLF